LTALLQFDPGRTYGCVLGTWESTDGLTWSESPAGAPADAHVSHTGSAWQAEVRSDSGDPNGEHWVHVGGA
jgi:hypothetical protein